MARTIATGEQDFGKIIKYNSFYVDKTMFIKEWWENRDTVTLITRPRRFGKTLTMNMLDYFFSVKHAGRSDLFEDLDIWNEEKYRELQGSYPVIFFSFAGIKGSAYEAVREGIIQELADVCNQYAFLLNSDKLTKQDKDIFRKINEDMSDMTAARSLRRLSNFLYNHYGKKVIILLDEYDTPMQEACVNGYWDELTAFIRSLFNFAFKTNPYLERAVMTGITRVSKESVFSDLNNPEVVTTTSKKYEAAFGFTEDEVFKALEEFGLQHEKEAVKHWYDGFRFGNCDSIYNPWSITQFLEKKEFHAYWANTSSNDLVRKLVQESSTDVKIIMEELLKGKSFRTAIDEQIVFCQLDHGDDSAIWSFLLAGGYLKIADTAFIDPLSGSGDVEYELALTNLEILATFRKMVHDWFSNKRYGYNDFLKALLMNDLENMNVFMNRLTLAVVSNFDSGNKSSDSAEPERFYHGFVLGLMVDLGNKYTLLSNREGGFGRYDVLLEPLNGVDDGIIFEFKVFHPRAEKNLADTADSAVRQILDRKYAAALEMKCRRDKIRIYGFAFRGKEVLIKGGYLPELENIYRQKGII